MSSAHHSRGRRHGEQGVEEAQDAKTRDGQDVADMAVRGPGGAVMPHLEESVAASCIVRVKQPRDVLQEMRRLMSKC